MDRLPPLPPLTFAQRVAFVRGLEQLTAWLARQEA